MRSRCAHPRPRPRRLRVVRPTGPCGAPPAAVERALLANCPRGCPVTGRRQAGRMRAQSGSPRRRPAARSDNTQLCKSSLLAAFGSPRSTQLRGIHQCRWCRITICQHNTSPPEQQQEQAAAAAAAAAGASSLGSSSSSSSSSRRRGAARRGDGDAAARRRGDAQGASTRLQQLLQQQTFGSSREEEQDRRPGAAQGRSPE